MDLDFAFLCDYAEVTNKINALGIGFNAITAVQVPHVHPLFFLVVQIRSTVVEAGQKKLEVRLIDADGNDIMPTRQMTFEVPKPTSGIESLGRMNIALRNISFPHYGSYSLHILVDGHPLHRVGFSIAKPPTTA